MTEGEARRKTDEPGGSIDPGRRRATAALLIPGVSALLTGWPARTRASTEVIRRHAAQILMGTRVDLLLEGPDSTMLAHAARRAFAQMERWVALLSHFRPTSQVGALNLAAGLQPVAVAPEVMGVLRQAREVSLRSAGAFDVTVGSVGRWHFDPARPSMPLPDEIARGLGFVGHRWLRLDESAGTAFLSRRGMRVDLGGIAKLPILQAGLRSLQGDGVEQALINGGGDILAIGRDDRPAWRVGVRDPREPSAVFGVLELRRGVVASSGDYVRRFERDGRSYHHVLDPRTGYPTEGPHAVTLLAGSVEAVNGLGAAVMVLGRRRGLELVAHNPAVEALVVERDHSLAMTPGMQRRLVRARADAEGLLQASG